MKPAYTSSSATSFFTYIDLCFVAQSDDVTGGGGFTGYGGSTGGGYGYSGYSGSGSGASKNANPALFSHPVRVVVTKYVTNKEVLYVRMCVYVCMIHVCVCSYVPSFVM